MASIYSSIHPSNITNHHPSQVGAGPDTSEASCPAVVIARTSAHAAPNMGIRYTHSQSRTEAGGCEGPWLPHSARPAWSFQGTRSILKSRNWDLLLGRRLTVTDAQVPRKLQTKKRTGIFLQRREENRLKQESLQVGTMPLF